MRHEDNLTSAITKVVAVIIGVVIIIAAVIGVLVFYQPAFSFSVGTSTSVGTAGSPVTFTVIPSISSATITSVLWNFGDGNTQTTTGGTTTHTYSSGGFYLIAAQVTATYQGLVRSFTSTVTNNQELFPLQIQSNLTVDQSKNASVPTINFVVTKNAHAPVVNIGETVYPIGGFLEAPSNSNWTIQKYDWNFGNGQTQSVGANIGGNLLPLKNVTTSYSTAGLYPMSLTLTTNSSTGGTFSVTTVHTIAVQSSATPYAILTTSGGVINPNVITTVEVVPGGPSSFDPQIDYETVGFEEIANVFQTLVEYNGSNSGSFIPVVAAALPTTSNGGISSDFRNYTFTIRSGLTFSNGDPLTAYDVWFSLERAIAFVAGAPGTPDWIQSQFLVPGAQNATSGISIYTNNTWPYATDSITYSNSSNTVTFHFNRPMPATLVFQVLGDPLGAGIVDSKYAASVGAAFSKNTAGFAAYMNQGNLAGYNSKMQWSPIGSGPYMVQSYTPGQSVELVPNPKYTPVPGIPAATKTVVIDWVKTPDTALLMLQDGQADAGGVGIPPSDFPALQKLQSQGELNIYSFPTITVFFYSFNINISKSVEASQFGQPAGYFTEPSNYFADLPTRLAFIDSYPYADYLNNILGNKKYGATFGVGYQGIMPQGLLYYVPASQLGGLPTQNLNDAKGNYSISAWANQNIKVPIVVPSGDPTEYAAAQEWAANLSQISNGHITAVPVTITFHQQIVDQVPGANPMGVYFLGWIADYPDPTDYVDAMYKAGGAYPLGNSWTTSPADFALVPSGLNPTSTALAPNTPNDYVNVNGTKYTQDKVYAWINGNITVGDTSTDPSVRQRSYKISEELAIDMGLYTYVYQPTAFWFFRSWIHGNGPIGSANFPSAQENPMIGAGGDILYYWLSKG